MISFSVGRMGCAAKGESRKLCLMVGSDIDAMKF